MARAGYNRTITTAPVVIFAPGDGGCTSFMVHCVDGSASAVLVQVQRLHGTSWIPVRPGRDMVFRLNHKSTGGITKVTVKAHHATAQIDYGVVADTDRADER